VEAISRDLCGSQPAALAPRLFTFQDFAEEIIRVNDPAARPLSNIQRRLLADDIVEKLHAEGELSHFQRIIDTRGFAEGVFAFLAELKRNEIWPDELGRAIKRLSGRKRAAGTDRFARARQCHLIYAEYQRYLVPHQLFDLEGRFWYARDLLKKGRWEPFQDVRAVFVDGFTDFTGVQHGILRSIGRLVDELWITLPDEPGDERAELFTRSRATVERLRQTKPRVELLPPRTTARAKSQQPAGLAHLERQLFRPLRAVDKGRHADGILLVKAPGMLGETRMVARRIKTLLAQGMPADDILVTMRDIRSYADLVREVFREYGIPIDIEGIEPLVRNPAVATLLKALRLREDGWPFGPTTALLRSTYMRPDWPETRQNPEIIQQAEALLRLLDKPRGRQAYLHAIDQWADKPPPGLEDEQADESRRQKTHELAQLCRPVLQRFFGVWNDLPDRGTLAALSSALRRFAENLGITKSGAETPQDCTALQRFWDEIDRWIEVDRQLQNGARTRDWAQFYRILGAIAAEAGLGRTLRGPGRVRILSAPLARTLSVPYLFVMDLGEGSFPRLTAPEPFFEEQERLSFKQAGLELLGLTDLMPDELLLFYQLVTRANRQLILSYPAVDEKGQATLPSSFLQTLLDCFQPGAVEIEEQRMLIERYDRADPLSPAELRVRSVSDAVAAGDERKNDRILESVSPDLTANLARAAVMARQRFGRDFGPFDGLVRDPAIVAELDQLVGPQQVFSPTALEDYILCPFRFFMSHVLRLQPLEDPTEEIEAAKRGMAYHRALARLHQRLHQSGEHQPTQAVDQLLQEQLAKAVAEYAARGSPASAELWKLEGERLQRQAGGYGPHWQAFVKPWLDEHVIPRPQLFEQGFGMKPEADETPAPPLVLTIDGMEVRIRGRIDRVDVAQLEDGVGYWVIDYKTGQPDKYTGTALKSFARLQLTLYALAVEQVVFAGQKARPLGLIYWLVADKGPKLAMPGHGKQSTAWLADSAGWADVRKDLTEWVATLVRHIRAGTFPLKPRSDNCTESCDFAQVCRINQVRAIPKTWELPLPK
jgi:ATP-dependent helicase/nuclease subunit B